MMYFINAMVKHIIFLFILLLLACGGETGSVCPDMNCADYASQQSAQTAFDLNPDCRNDLDADKDGVACEEYNYGGGSTGGGSTGGGTGGGGCPTTANCGCSGKNKDACASACCKWVVGDGCKCK